MSKVMTGSVWFYKIRKGGTEGTLANKDIEQRYMPVVFDNTDRVMVESSIKH